MNIAGKSVEKKKKGNIYKFFFFLFLLGGFFTGGLVYWLGPNIVGYSTRQYLLCGACHHMEDVVAGHIRSTHWRKATCKDCHSAETEDAIRHTYKAVKNVFNPSVEKMEARVETAKCLKCHDKTVDHIDKWQKDGFVNNMCFICHKNTFHIK